MPRRYTILIASFVLSEMYCLSILAKKNKNETSLQSYKQRPLFNDDEILYFRPTGKLKHLFNDRSDSSSFHPLLLQFMHKDSNVVSIHIIAKIRGHFRRDIANCKMPPLLLSFSKEEKSKNILFEKQSKL